MLTQGKFDNSSGNSFTISIRSKSVWPGRRKSATATTETRPAQIKARPLGAWILKFVPGAFTAGNAYLISRSEPSRPMSTVGREPCATFGRARPAYLITTRVPTSHPFGTDEFANVNLAINPLIPLDFAGTAQRRAHRLPLPRSDVLLYPGRTILSRGRSRNRTRGERRGVAAAGRPGQLSPTTRVRPCADRR